MLHFPYLKTKALDTVIANCIYVHCQLSGPSKLRAKVLIIAYSAASDRLPACTFVGWAALYYFDAKILQRIMDVTKPVLLRGITINP